MSSPGDLSETERLSLALAGEAYRTGTVRLAGTDISGFSHIAATRQGLFAVGETRASLIAHGLFFGIVPRGNALYVFEACDLPRLHTGRGRIVRFVHDGSRIVSAEVIAADLDSGCHHIDFIDGRLCVLDTYNQRIVRLSEDGAAREDLYPLPRAEVGDWAGGYVHINSLLQVGDRILLLLHNGFTHTGRKSAVAVFDLAWRRQALWPLPGENCHDLAVLDDGTLLSCGSAAGELIALDGRRIKVTELMTRGLSVGAESIAIGASTFSSRRDRHRVPGAISFLDRAYASRTVLELPGAPTTIRRLDGQDYSLSEFVKDRVPLPKAPET